MQLLFLLKEEFGKNREKPLEKSVKIVYTIYIRVMFISPITSERRKCTILLHGERYDKKIQSMYNSFRFGLRSSFYSEHHHRDIQDQAE